ncbi:MAG: N5-glutamine methyltransferase family protein, partial [Candidatus Margulisiibacteriota bacterium]
MKIFEALAWATDYLKKNNIEDAKLEAEILLAATLNLKRTSLITQNHRTLTPEIFSIYQQYLQRRSKHEPTAYITGVQPFMSLNFFIDRSVLIPRPETERLVEVAIESCQSCGTPYAEWIIA